LARVHLLAALKEKGRRKVSQSGAVKFSIVETVKIAYDIKGMQELILPRTKTTNGPGG
jgi:hypothetical protein